MPRTAGWRRGRWPASSSPAAIPARSWQHSDPLILDMYRKMGGASIQLRHFARMHELCKLYREAERILREFKLNDEWYIKPTEKDGQRLGRHRGDPRRPLPLDRR